MEKLYVASRLHRTSPQPCARHSPHLHPRRFWGHNRIPHQLVSTFRPGSLVIDLIPQIENDKRQVKQAHDQRTATIDQDIEQAIAHQAGSLTGLDEVQAIERKITAVNQLQAQLSPRLEIARQQAHSFFGTDPEHRNFQEFLAVIRSPNAPAEPRPAWLASYRAAFEVKYLEQQSNALTQRQYQLRSALSSARLKATRNRNIDIALNRAEQAIVRSIASSQTSQLALKAMQKMLDAFDHHRHEDIAEEMALEHGRELQRETSNLLKAREHLILTAASNRGQARQLANEISRIEFDLKFFASQGLDERRPEMLALQAEAQAHAAKAAQSAPAEQAAVQQLRLQATRAIEAAFDEQALLATLSGQTPSNTPVTFNAWTASTGHALVLASSRGGTADFEPAWHELGKALGKAAERLLAGAGLAIARYASLMLYTTRLGDGERMGVTVPLALMAPGAELTQEANRKAGQPLELPLRMNAAPHGTQTEVYLAATDGSSILRDVRVRQAQWDAAEGAYRFTTEGPGGATLLWHPATPPSTLDA